MNELASDAIGADSTLMEGNTFLGLVEWVRNDLLTELVLSMGILAFEAIATSLGSAPLSAHFRFIFAFVDLGATSDGLVCLGVEAKALDGLELGRGLDDEVGAFVARIATLRGCVGVLVIAGGRAVGVAALALISDSFGLLLEE